MKRNLEMVREILLIIEQKEDNPNLSDISNGLREAGYDNISSTSRNLEHHLQIMDEAGLIECQIFRVAGDSWGVSGSIRLHWLGHEYLDSIRDIGVWDQIKGTVGHRIDSITFEVIKSAAKKIIESSIM